MNKEDQIKKWLSGELTPEELSNFEETEEFKELNRLDRALGHFKAPEFNAEVEFASRKNKPTKPQGKVISLTSFNRVAVRWAAAILLLSVFSMLFWFNNMEKQEQVFTEAQKTFYLPDSSSVHLNKESSLAIKDNWEEGRMVRLKGEAYFQVKKGSTFLVETNNGTVQVLGTVFNVKSRGQLFEVTCFEGRVEVDDRNTKTIIRAGESVTVFAGQSLARTREQMPNQPDWMNGQSYFDNIPCAEVFEELERQYAITLQRTAEMTDCTFTGGFPHTDVDLALQSVTVALGLEYQKIGESTYEIISSSD